MRINPEKASAYNSVTPAAIVYDIQVTSTSIAEKVAAADKERFSHCDKTQLKAIAAELRTVEKRLDWILNGKY